MDLTITVRDNDIPLLDDLAERDWRHREQQASAMLEVALGAARARANAPERSRNTSRRAPLSRPTTNGVAVAH